MGWNVVYYNSALRFMGLKILNLILLLNFQRVGFEILADLLAKFGSLLSLEWTCFGEKLFRFTELEPFFFDQSSILSNFFFNPKNIFSGTIELVD